MSETFEVSTILADAAALLDLPDRIEHLQGWFGLMLKETFQIPNDPIAELDQAQAVLMGIRVELRERGYFLPEVVAPRVDPLGFIRESHSLLTTVQRFVRSVPVEIFFAAFAIKH